MPARRPRLWEVELYEQADGMQPAEAYFEAIPEEVFQRLQGYIDYVAEDPLGFPAGAEWQAMHGEALGCHEVRVFERGRLYRVFVRLDAARPGGAGVGRLVLLGGADKPPRTALPDHVYREVGRAARDYMAARRVSPAEA